MKTVGLCLLFSLAFVGCGSSSRSPDAADGPTDSAGLDAPPTDATRADAAPADAAPTDTAPADTAPADAAPADTASVDTASNDTTPSDAAPADAAQDLSPEVGPPTQLGVLAALTDTKLYLLSLDSAGTATMKSTAPIPDVGQHLARSTDGRHLYVLGRTVAAYGVDKTTLSLSALGAKSTGLTNWSGVAVDRLDRWLVLSDRSSGLSVLSLSANGELGTAVASAIIPPPAEDIGFDPAGKIAFAPSCAGDTITRYVLNAETGALSAPLTSKIPGERGPGRIAFGPSGKTVYALTFKKVGITAFDYDPSSGAMVELDTLDHHDPSTVVVDGSCLSSHMVFHPGGKIAYASLQQSGGTVAIMSVSSSGKLALVAHERYFLFRGADALAIDPTGTFLVVGNHAGGSQIFKIDPTDGRLTYVSNTVAGIWSLTFLP